jgi:acetyl-CoA synthetase (ADP-forming)/acetyltransferase
VAEARRIASQRGLPSYDAPERAIEVFLRIDEYRRNRELLMQTPPSVPEGFVPDVAAARRVVVQALQAGRDRLAEAEAFAVLRAYGIAVAVPEGRRAQGALRAATAEMMIGVASDPVFGPIIVAGRGGAGGEGRRVAVALPPLNMLLARDLALRAGAAEQGACFEALSLTLVQVSQLIADLDEVVELEVDPLRLAADGVAARHARMRIAPHRRHLGSRRFAIRPYPRELEQQLRWHDQDIVLRPIRPEDEVVHGAFLDSLVPEDARYRFFSTMRHLPHTELARYTHIDYDREMALIAVGRDAEEGLLTLGEVRAVADPDNVLAEFAIVVRSELKGMGLGRLLLERMIAYLRSRGTRELRGETMLDNERMKNLARDCGFTVVPQLTLGVVELRLALNP